jgi:hypothetical protein
MTDPLLIDDRDGLNSREAEARLYALGFRCRPWGRTATFAHPDGREVARFEMRPGNAEQTSSWEYRFSTDCDDALRADLLTAASACIPAKVMARMQGTANDLRYQVNTSAATGFLLNMYISYCRRYGIERVRQTWRSAAPQDLPAIDACMVQDWWAAQLPEHAAEVARENGVTR